MYNVVLTAQKKAIAFLASSFQNQASNTKQVKASSVDQIARSYIISHGYKSIPHSLGHGIGIEVHEQPRLSPKSKEVLKPGMVFSIEPGIYIPGYGGVRIEDILVIENFTSRRAEPSGRRLTHSPKEIIEI